MNNTIGKGNVKRIKFFVAVVFLTVALIAAVLICITIFNNGKSANNHIFVYEKNNNIVIRIGNLETSVSDSTAADFKCDTKNKRVFYTVPSSVADGLYDLYYIEKNRSELTKPKIIDYGIEDDYMFNSGKIYYLKKNLQAGAEEAYCCDFSDSTIKSFSSNVESIYPLDNSSTVFFIKLHGDERVLYKYSGETPIEVCRNISEIHLYNIGDNSHIFYEKASEIYNGMTELYRIDKDGAPELICDNTYKVLYDEYSSDGNLYYFTSSKDNISWSYVIADTYEETDKTITRPKRDSFLSILGISVEYNEKLREYQDKLVRDEIREALNDSVKKGEFSAPVYNAFVYNSEGSHKIAENINPDNVFATSKFGLPRIIFESSEIVKSTTNMATLVDIAQRSSINEVIEYARSVINNSIKSNGIKVAGCNETGCIDYNLDGYDIENTSFEFSENGERVFAVVHDKAGDRLKLFSFSLGSDLKPSPKFNVNNGISSYYFIDNSVIYLKADIGKNTGDIYIYSGEDNIKLSNAANALKVDNNNKIFSLKDYNDSTNPETADYYIINDFQEKLLSENVIVNSFVVNDSDDAAYISNDNCLYVYSNGKNSQISDNVSDIIFFD